MSKQYRQDVPDGRFHHRMTRTVDGHKLGFEWHGGAYIEVCQGDQYAHPAEVINVWDYADDSPRYPRTKAGMRQAVTNWLGNYGRDNLLRDMTYWS